MTATLVDVERPVRDWLRGQSLAVGERVYIGAPRDAVYPLIDMMLLDGGVMAGDTPMASPSFTFSVWGDSPNADRPALAACAWALADLLRSTNHAVLDSTLVLTGAVIQTGPLPRFDPDGTPRYLLDAALTVKVNA
jgi:hypothetical protein